MVKIGPIEVEIDEVADLIERLQLAFARKRLKSVRLSKFVKIFKKDFKRKYKFEPSREEIGDLITEFENKGILRIIEGNDKKNYVIIKEGTDYPSEIPFE